jgi:hypothetical protein
MAATSSTLHITNEMVTTAYKHGKNAVDIMSTQILSTFGYSDEYEIKSDELYSIYTPLKDTSSELVEELNNLLTLHDVHYICKYIRNNCLKDNHQQEAFTLSKTFYVAFLESLILDLESDCAYDEEHTLADLIGPLTFSIIYVHNCIVGHQIYHLNQLGEESMSDVLFASTIQSRVEELEDQQTQMIDLLMQTTGACTEDSEGVEGVEDAGDAEEPEDTGNIE